MNRHLIPLVALPMLMGCFSEEVSFSSTTGTSGQTVQITGRVKVVNPNVGGIQTDFRVEPPLVIVSCANTTNVDALSGVNKNSMDGLWRAVMIASEDGTPWPKGPRNLFTCNVQIPTGTSPGDYFIHSTNLGGSSINGAATSCVEKAGGKIHVNS